MDELFPVLPNHELKQKLLLVVGAATIVFKGGLQECEWRVIGVKPSVGEAVISCLQYAHCAVFYRCLS